MIWALKTLIRKNVDADAQKGRSHLQRRLDAVGNMSAFARAHGLDRRMLDRYREGMEPSVGNALKIATALGIGLDELVQGVSAQTSDEIVQVSDTVSIPLLAAVGSAGDGLTSDGDGEISRLPFSRALLRELGVQPQNCHFIRAKGDSMVPKIGEGAIVLIDLARAHSREDGIYALMVGDDVRIKRLHFAMFGGLSVMSDNPAYPEETFGAGEIDRIKIVGKVVWIGGVA